MTAAQARKLSDDNKDSALTNVLKKIEDAATKGYIQISFSKLPDYLSDELKKLGFSVDAKKVSSYGTVDISW